MFKSFDFNVAICPGLISYGQFHYLQILFGGSKQQFKITKRIEIAKIISDLFDF